MCDVSIDIRSEDDKYCLVFLLDKELAPIAYYLVIKDLDTGEEELWDNENFLDAMYLTIKLYLNRESFDTEMYYEFNKEIPVNDFESVKELFDKGNELGLWVE